MITLGRREHWLLEQSQLNIDIGNRLGSGGFGYVASGVYHGTPVAVKTQQRLQDDRRLATQLHELRIFRQVRHPNIAVFFGAYIDTSLRSVSLVVEWIEGGTLAAYI